MTSFVQRLIHDDFVWVAITNALSGKRRQSSTSFININCPMCVSRGETPDKKQRCGIKRSNYIGVFCFNCGFRSRWEPGELVSKSMREFLSGIGVSDFDILKLNHKALTYRSMLSSSPEAVALLPDAFVPKFDSMSLPKGARSIQQWAEDGCTDPDFLDVADYLLSRGEAVSRAATYFWTPNKESKYALNRRVIVPFHFEGKTVGYTCRTVDNNSQQRYYMEAPSNFLFNSRALTISNRKYVILCEGVFDALAVDGVGLLGARLNAQQVAWIKSTGKVPILVPDRDKRGLELIDIAVENNWHVAFPRGLKGTAGDNSWWDADVKDIAEAAKRYGRLWTLLSIVESATNNNMKINVQRKVLLS